MPRNGSHTRIGLRAVLWAFASPKNTGSRSQKRQNKKYAAFPLVFVMKFRGKLTRVGGFLSKVGLQARKTRACEAKKEKQIPQHFPLFLLVFAKNAFRGKIVKLRRQSWMPSGMSPGGP
jgi:hypothetical protein